MATYAQLNAVIDIFRAVQLGFIEQIAQLCGKMEMRCRTGVLIITQENNIYFYMLTYDPKLSERFPSLLQCSAVITRSISSKFFTIDTQ